MSDIADDAGRYGSLENVQFSRLLVLKRHGATPARKRTWLCKCSCGNETVQTTGSLRSGRVVSCGCFNDERIGKLKLRHGNAKASCRSPEYESWLHMIGRCTCKTNRVYSLYGGRGISVCENWFSFENFLKDVGFRPSKDHSIDRIDVNGNYEPSNCRWATKSEQARNRRTNVMVSIDGQTKCVKEWCEITGVNPGTALSRIKNGFDPVLSVTEKTTLVKTKNHPMGEIKHG